MRVGRFGLLLAPSYGQCAKCRTPWRFVEGHIVDYLFGHNWSQGMFALCEQCWAESSINERLGYYLNLYDKWHRPDDDDLREQLRQAVL